MTVKHSRTFSVYKLPSEALDALVAWRMNDPALCLPIKVTEHGIEYPHMAELDFTPPEEQTNMQRQFNIELRVDYADNEKNESMKQAIRRAARIVLATAQLLADGVKPQITMYSDDFFEGHDDISLFEAGEGAGESLLTDQEEVSEEMLALAANMQQGR